MQFLLALIGVFAIGVFSFLGGIGFAAYQFAKLYDLKYGVGAWAKKTEELKEYERSRKC